LRHKQNKVVENIADELDGNRVQPDLSKTGKSNFYRCLAERSDSTLSQSLQTKGVEFKAVKLPG
jgi:hypothetical protein